MFLFVQEAHCTRAPKTREDFFENSEYARCAGPCDEVSDAAARACDVDNPQEQQMWRESHWSLRRLYEFVGLLQRGVGTTTGGTCPPPARARGLAALRSAAGFLARRNNEAAIAALEEFCHKIPYGPRFRFFRLRAVARAALRALAPPAERRFAGSTIPKLVHRTLFWDVEPPLKVVHSLASWEEQNGADFEEVWHDEASLLSVMTPAERRQWRGYSGRILRADFGRLVLVHRFGGCYVDLDVQARAPVRTTAS